MVPPQSRSLRMNCISRNSGKYLHGERQRLQHPQQRQQQPPRLQHPQQQQRQQVAAAAHVHVCVQ
jgi:hypothetical protein